MAHHLGRNVLLLSALLLLLAYSAMGEDDNEPPNSEEDDDDSSSEETVEDSNESRRKRSAEQPPGDNASRAADGGQRAAIPGLPDPATIVKIAEILQTVGDKVIPILVEGNAVTELVTERISKDFAFLKNFKEDVELFAKTLKLQ